MLKLPAFLFLANRILCSPLESLFTLLVFILSKNLDASPMQLVIITCIKPISAFFSFYVSSVMFDQQQRMRQYLIFINILGCALCFFYPFIENVWFYVVSYALYMVCRKAATPAWLEIVKNNSNSDTMTKTVSYGNSIYYFITLALPPLACFWMDLDASIWKFIFIAFSSLQVLSTILILSIDKKFLKITNIQAPVSFSGFVIDPLKKAWNLLVQKPSFRDYQILYFLGGASIVFIQPILPIYFKENLHLSYSQLGIAFSFCKGISFLFASPFWARWVGNNSLFKLHSHVNILICLYILSLTFSNFGKEWIYLAYLFYGTTQAGSELGWHLSGPIFSEKKESILYSGVNLALVGLRGCICPLLSHLIFISSGVYSVFLVSFIVCFAGVFYGYKLDAKYQKQPIS